MNDEDYLQLKLYEEANLILIRRVTRLEEELQRERELTAQKSIQIETLSKKLDCSNMVDELNDNIIDKMQKKIDALEKEYYEQVQILLDDKKQMQWEIDKLREALKNCIPFTATTGNRMYMCEFCFDKPHTEDCEYVRLCGGDKE